MEIKDLSVQLADLEEVRGGVGNVDVYLNDYSQVNPSQNVTIGGGKKSQTVLTKSPVEAVQQVDASRSFDLYMPITENRKTDTDISILGSTFQFGW